MQPVLFLGHGSPMHAITENRYRRAWRELGARLPRPEAILCVSAHWQTPASEVCGVEKPRSIHDFYGFPPELYTQNYPAPGAPDLARRVQALAGSHEVNITQDWGLDHGAWALLASMFPQADVPVCQLSLARGRDYAAHYALARSLLPLREEGVLVLASGNIVHNLAFLAEAPPYDWALAFDTYVRDALISNDVHALLEPDRAGVSKRHAVPTDEHYLPLIYAMGLRCEEDRLEWLIEDFDLASLGMRSFAFDSEDPA